MQLLQYLTIPTKSPSKIPDLVTETVDEADSP